MNEQTTAIAAAEADDDDDPVVAEMDVIVCPGPSSADSSNNNRRRIFLAQYPLLAEPPPVDVQLNARLRAKTNRMEIDIPIQTKSNNYDKLKGQDLSSATDDVFAHHTLASFNADGYLAPAYSILRIQDGKAMLEPLSGCLQFRNSLGYLNRIKKEREAKKKQMEEGESSQSESEAEVAKSVTVKFTRDSTKKRDRKIAEDTEPWTPLTITPKSKEETYNETKVLIDRLSQIRTPEIPAESSSVTASKHSASKELSAIRSFIPEAKEDRAGEGKQPNHVLSLNELKALRPRDRVVALMKNAKVLPFNQLRCLLQIHNTADLLTYLSECATLVRGIWVVNSNLIFKEETVSEKTGSGAGLLQHTRDFILYRMREEDCILQKDIYNASKVHSDDLKDILREIGRNRQSRGWSFAYPTDQDFIDNHPTVVEQENRKWEARWVVLRDWLKSNMESVAASSTSAKRGKSPRRSRNASSRRSSIESMDVVKDEFGSGGEKNPRKRLQSGHKNHKGSSNNNNAAAVPSSTTSSSLSVGERELRSFLYETLTESKVIHQDKLMSKLRLKLAESMENNNPLHSLPKPIPPKLVIQHAVAIGAKLVTNKEYAKDGYILWDQGSIPEIRPKIVEYLLDKHRFRFKSMKDTLEKSLPSSLPSDEKLKSILVDYCESRNGMYALKGSPARLL